ncbi:MAG TPA: PAS domain-containing sensor histidine kinase [Bryobacteraceae bacterium]|nr:PAS domain-containing sensor histidine kinase [Bryobacteraceae bacterium]
MRIPLVILQLLVLLAPAAAVRAAAPEPPLTQIHQIRRLTAAQAGRGYPVHVRAVVTYYAPPYTDPRIDVGFVAPVLFIQDDTAGIFVNLPADAPPLRAGQVVDMEGVTEALDFAPQIGHPRYRVVGRGPLPVARRASLESMLSTVEDGQWVETDGIVRRVAPDAHILELEVAVAGGRLRTRMPRPKGDPGRLVDAEVRVRGVCGALFNRDNQLIGALLYVPGLDQVAVRRAAPPDPFAAAPQPISELQRFAPGRELGHRVRVQGFVTLQPQKQVVYIYDGRNGVRVELSAPVSLQPGTLLDVLGYPNTLGMVPVLEDAVCRRRGGTAPVVPLPVTARQILEAEYDSVPVAIEGQVLERSLTSGMPALALQSGAMVFEAELPRSKMDLLPPAGAYVRVTGICAAARDENGGMRAFRILSGPGGVHVLRYPSWWTADRARGALALVSFMVLLAGAWVISLRRRVREHVALIRQRLEREAALEQRFHHLLDNAHDMIFTADADGRLVSINRAGEQISGYVQDQSAGTPLAALFEAGQPAIAEAMDRVAHDGSYWTPDWAVTDRRGRLTPVEVSLQAIREGGRLAGILGIARDLSDRRQAEQALLRARQLAGARDTAEQASRAKSAFLANMSHELRAPLNAIIGYSQLLQEDWAAPDQAPLRADLRKIERAGQILLTQINDVLDLSKIESGRETVQPQDVDLAAVLEDVRNAVTPLARAHGNRVEIDCPAHARAVYADPAKFRQSLLNLVNNACKFTENGRVSIAVNRRRDAHGEWTEVHVSDTGLGIAPEDLDKLFQPFSQVDNARRRKHEGTGLGLAISRKFCRMMGGDITVSSQPGRGSRFSIRLPAARRETVSQETEVSRVQDSVGRR